MPDSSRLRIESSDGTPVKEYRILGSQVEVRTQDLASPMDSSHGGWWRLTPEQLSVHVERNTVVAKWLELRLGWRNLLRACVGAEVWSDTSEVEPESGQPASRHQ